jgi:hypothetical protein
MRLQIATKPFKVFRVLMRSVFTVFNIIFTKHRTANRFQLIVGLAMFHLPLRDRAAVLNTLGVSLSAESLYDAGRKLASECAPEKLLASVDPLNVVGVAMDNFDVQYRKAAFRPDNLGGKAGGMHTTMLLCYVIPNSTSLSALFDLLLQLHTTVSSLAFGSRCELGEVFARLRRCPLLTDWQLSGAECSAIEAVRDGVFSDTQRGVVLDALRRAHSFVAPFFVEKPLLPPQVWLNQSGALQRFGSVVLGHSVQWARCLLMGETPYTFKQHLFRELAREMPQRVTKIALRPLLTAPNNSETVAAGLAQIRQELGAHFKNPNVNISLSADEAVMRHIVELAADRPSEYSWATPLMGVLHLRMNASDLLLARMVPAGLPDLMLGAQFSENQTSKLGKLDFDRRNALLSTLVHGLHLALVLVAATFSEAGAFAFTLAFSRLPVNCDSLCRVGEAESPIGRSASEPESCRPAARSG